MRGMESRMKWDTYREEQRQRMLEKKAYLDGHREWRRSEERGFQELIAAQGKATKLNDLQISKEFQEFKREARSQSREADREHAGHVFKSYQDFQALQQALSTEWKESAKEVQAHRRLLAQGAKEAKALELMKEKTTELEDQAEERRKDLEQMARDALAQKEQLLQSIDYERRCRAASPVSELAQKLSTAHAQRLAPPSYQSKN